MRWQVSWKQLPSLLTKYYSHMNNSIKYFSVTWVLHYAILNYFSLSRKIATFQELYPQVWLLYSPSTAVHFRGFPFKQGTEKKSLWANNDWTHKPVKSSLLHLSQFLVLNRHRLHNSWKLLRQPVTAASFLNKSHFQLALNHSSYKAYPTPVKTIFSKMVTIRSTESEIRGGFLKPASLANWFIYGQYYKACVIYANLKMFWNGFFPSRDCKCPPLIQDGKWPLLGTTSNTVW